MGSMLTEGRRDTLRPGWVVQTICPPSSIHRCADFAVASPHNPTRIQYRIDSQYWVLLGDRALR